MEEHTQIGQLIEPEAIPFSFEAPGWYMLLALMFLVFLIIAFIFFLRYRKLKYRRQAILQLQKLNLEKLNSTSFTASVMEIIKRVAITSYGRAGIVSSNGMLFLDLLKEKNKGKAVFSDQERFSTSIYQKADLNIQDKEIIIEESIKWITKHHV